MSDITVALGSDRGGFAYKSKLLSHLNDRGIKTIDVGTYVEEVCDYPVFAEKAGRLVASKEADYGILICGSGEGMAIAANKVKGVRCGIPYDDEVAALLRQHNDANMIAFGAKFMAYEDVERRTDIFLSTDFLGSYHAERVGMITKMENN